ncbi:MAG: hypothetical protein JWQ84_619 [Mucilaginibacter sp.]|jgi:DNA-binding response OmpR family regulator|nr:hypothetical protein [Mucilaginibacter sp.]MDB5140553.1 hypothetical protein [Mucilaginibacter sp.]
MKKIIYVVEDNIDISELIQYLLSEIGFEVFTFGNLTDFQQYMAINQPDLIVMDIMLPDGNGQQMCQEIKLNEVTKHIPLLLMSAHANGSSLAKEGFADEFITKPFDIDNFTARVQAYFS